MSEECCLQEIEFLKKRLDQLNTDTKKLKQEYQNLLVENLQKDCIIRKLKQRTIGKPYSTALKQIKYDKFKETLSDTCLDNLKLIGNSQREDSRFISVALNDLYRENIDILKKKTLGSRSKDSEKTVISPEKIRTIENLFAERISYIPKAEVNSLRENNAHKLIRNALDGANRRK